uniref:Uncharacterized protein n=1 Tax=Oryza meridionalis TaxID=40149 RepID=A0A0E0C6R5_9ORYZ
MCVHSPTGLKPSDDSAREPKIIAAHDDLLLFRLTLGHVAHGWTAAKWSWIAESGCCRMDCRLRSSQISHHMMPTLPKPIYDTARRPQPSLEKLHVGHPVLSLHDAHLVYLMAKIEDRAHKAY